MNKNKRINIIFGLLLLVSTLILFSSNVLAIDGWVVPNGEAYIDNNNRLVIEANSQEFLMRTDYSFDVLAGTKYNFSYIIDSVEGCDRIFVRFSLSCLSNDSFTQSSCDGEMTKDLDISSGLGKPQSVLINTITSYPHLINGIYKKNTSFFIITEGPSCKAVLSNLSLREQKAVIDDVDYDYSSVPTTALTDESSCCPNDYCWNGTMCVSHTLWLPSDVPGIWSTDGGTKGYRCVLTDTGANWVFSEKKYDWDYEHTGYCQKNTDCFVGEEYVTEANLKYCISNGSFIKDINDITPDDDGNHYCHEGIWTTKTHLVAQLLIELSKGNPYVLHCYNNSDVTFNNWLGPYNSDSSNLASCVLIKQDLEDELNDQVITGIITKDGTDYALLDSLRTDYTTNTFSGMNAHPDLNLEECKDTEPVAGNFHECFRGANDRAPVYIYYEDTYKYFILSESPIDGLTRPTFWQNIINFFKRLFSGPDAPSVNPFDNMPLSNYDNIYLVSNEYGTVTAVEEMKYDSEKDEMLNVLYVDYNCSNNNYNVINLEDITKYVNDILIKNGFDEISEGDITYTYTDAIQRVSITTPITTGLWPYLTSTSRHRGISVFGCRAG